MNQQKQTRTISKFRLFLSLTAGIFISLVIGALVFDELPRNGNSNKEIEEIEVQILLLDFKLNYGREMKFANPFTWDQVDDFGYGIDSVNREIAIAKVMIGNSVPPKGFPELRQIWENRLELSQKEWKIYKLSDLYIKSILIGAGSVLLTIPGVWFVLGWMMIIIQFIWNFFLDRIAELSNAIKGKQVKADKTK